MLFVQPTHKFKATLTITATPLDKSKPEIEVAKYEHEINAAFGDTINYTFNIKNDILKGKI